MNISSSKGHDSVIISRPVPTEVDRCLYFKATVLKHKYLVKDLDKAQVCVVYVCSHMHVHTSGHTQACMLSLGSYYFRHWES